jgi:hypothetical protein
LENSVFGTEKKEDESSLEIYPIGIYQFILKAKIIHYELF